MRSFAAVVAFASLAFSAVVSALPTPTDQASSGLVDAIVKAPVDVSHTRILRDDSPLATVIVDVNAQIEPIIAKINAALSVNVGADVDLDVVANLFADIEAALGPTVVKVNDADDVSADVDVNVVVTAVVKLIADVSAVVGVLLDKCDSVDISVVLGVIAKVFANVAAIVSVAVKLDVSVLGQILAKVAVYIPVLLNAKVAVGVNALLNVLGLVA